MQLAGNKKEATPLASISSFNSRHTALLICGPSLDVLKNQCHGIPYESSSISSVNNLTSVSAGARAKKNDKW